MKGKVMFMKNLVSGARGFVVAGALLSIPVATALSAEPDAAAATNAPPKAAVAAAADSAVTVHATTTVQAKLPSGVADVVKLSRAKVSEDVVLSYVQNSGTTYSLGADDIVQMRKEGVSDRVINAMLDQHSKAMEIAQRAAAQATTSAEFSASSASVPAAEAVPTSAQQPVVEAPLTPSGSSVYVIPYPAATAAYYGYYSPYYYPCYYGGPVVSFGFGYGGCGYYGRGYYGGHGIYGYRGGHHR